MGNHSHTPGLLWLTGNRGSGKSTLASFLLSILKKGPFVDHCRFHFFIAGHQMKRTISYLLRSIALQTALSDSAFCKRLLDLYHKTGMTFGQQKYNIIWEKVFDGILFRLPSRGPIFWIIDGVDEAETPTELIRLFSKVRSASRINLLLVSRPTKTIEQEIDQYLPTVVREEISPADTQDDIRGYVRGIVQKILPSAQAQEDIIQEIFRKSLGSFLWVKLVLDKLKHNWHTESDIKAALTEMPPGMQPLYRRMIDIIANQPPKPQELAIQILTWNVCSFHPSDLEELQVGLASDFAHFVNIKSTIEEICGHFVVVDRGKVSLIHETAREFLLNKTSDLQIKINGKTGHTNIAMVCMEFLSDTSRCRRVFSNIQVRQQLQPSTSGASVFTGHPFLYYSLTFWTYHVSHASRSADDLPTKVLEFLEGSFLLWVNGVATSRNLRILTQAAQHLKAYAKKRLHKISKMPPLSLVSTRDTEIRQWATDIIRLVGRFSNNIVENPASVYKHVVPFCPKESIISRSLGHIGYSAFTVTGISSLTWDDCLARLTIGDDRVASQIVSKDTFFITLLGSDGTLVVWNAETCDEARRIVHGEWVSHMKCSRTSNLVATAGFKTTRVWDITTGEEMNRLPKKAHSGTLAIEFGFNDAELLLAYDNSTVQCVDLSTMQEKWSFKADEKGSKLHNCARAASFSPDMSQLALVFRGKPVLVWFIQPFSTSYIPPKRCVCAEDRFAPEDDASNNPEQVLWHPVTDHLLILYEGCYFGGLECCR